MNKEAYEELRKKAEIERAKGEKILQILKTSIKSFMDWTLYTCGDLTNYLFNEIDSYLKRKYCFLYHAEEGDGKYSKKEFNSYFIIREDLDKDTNLYFYEEEPRFEVKEDYFYGHVKEVVETFKKITAEACEKKGIKFDTSKLTIYSA